MKDQTVRRPGISPFVFVAILVFLIAHQATGGPVAGLTTFSNGTIADADEMNANFEAVRTAVDDNDARIGSLDLRVDALESRGAGQIIQSRGTISGSSSSDVWVLHLVSSSAALHTNILLPRDGTLSNFSVRSVYVTDPGTTVMGYVQINGVDVGNPVQFTNADGLTMKTASGSVSVSAGDMMTFHFNSGFDPMAGIYLAAVTYD